MQPSVDQLLEALPGAACVLDPAGRINRYNEVWRALMASQALLQEFTFPGAGFITACRHAGALDGFTALGARVQHVLSSQGSMTERYVSCPFSTGPRDYSARISPVPAAMGGCLILCEDITERRGVEHDLRRMQAAEAVSRQVALQNELLAEFGQFALEHPPFNELAARLVEVVREGLGAEFSRLLAMAGDEQQHLVHAAGLGWGAAMAEGQPLDPVVETEDRFVVGARETAVVADYATEQRIRATPLQRELGVRSSAEALITGGSGIHGIVGAYSREPGRFNADSAAFLQNLGNTVSAFLERKAYEERLSYMAQFDALTGLPNRGMYLERLLAAIEEAGRHQRPVGVLFVDVDRFKGVNDTLGHSVGDALLVSIAERLKSIVRPGDAVSRLSGDEFALVLGQLAQEDHASRVAQKVTEALATPFSIEGHTVYVSGSVGISLYPADGDDPEVLLKNADLAMYRAKQSGRNGYQYYLPQMQERAVSRLRIETQLRDALDRDEYVLHYQPKVDLATGTIGGLEALLRWDGPQGLVPPMEFIPVLEDTGLIIPVGERVLMKVCRQIRAWQEAGLDPPAVAVNVSARQFGQDQLDAAVVRVIHDSGVDPRLIELELTESLLMRDAESAVDILLRLKAHGIRLSLDDFGTGYSSLSYLKRFPLDALKIDRAFIRDVLEDPDDASIVSAIVNLARSLELKVVAEGVETPQQVSFLRQRGCDEAQGYYIAHPLPAAEMTQLLANRRRWRFGVEA